MGTSFASAARSLISSDKSNEEPIKRRFDAVITSDNLTELSTHARGLVQLMKASDFVRMFNYPAFAKDLYRYQFYEGRMKVRLRWGLDFYKANEKKDSMMYNERE